MARKRAAKKELVRPTAVDGHVGARVRQRRTMIGMNQQALAAQLGVSFQQLQKNEKGTNRIGCSRLVDLSRALDVPIQYFFDDMPASTAASSTAKQHRATDEGTVLSNSETLKLVRAYYRIKSANVRKRVYELAKSLADE